MSMSARISPLSMPRRSTRVQRLAAGGDDGVVVRSHSFGMALASGAKTLCRSAEERLARPAPAQHLQDARPGRPARRCRAARGRGSSMRPHDVEKSASLPSSGGRWWPCRRRRCGRCARWTSRRGTPSSSSLQHGLDDGPLDRLAAGPAAPRAVRWRPSAASGSSGRLRPRLRAPASSRSRRCHRPDSRHGDARGPLDAASSAGAHAVLLRRSAGSAVRPRPAGHRATTSAPTQGDGRRAERGHDAWRGGRRRSPGRPAPCPRAPVGPPAPSVASMDSPAACRRRPARQRRRGAPRCRSGSARTAASRARRRPVRRRPAGRCC